MTNTDSAANDRDIVLTRTFDAPRNLVFKAWTDPDLIAHWWGPKGMTTRVTELDLRPGGSWRFVMVAPDGNEYPMTGVFSEVVPPERVVSDGLDPRGPIAVVTFEEDGGKTLLTLCIPNAPIEAGQEQMNERVDGGWNSSFDCLELHLDTL